MVYEWYDSTRTLKVAVILTGVNFIVFTTAFFTPYWLQSVPDERLPNPKFTNLGKIYLYEIKSLSNYLQIILKLHSYTWVQYSLHDSLFMG